MDSSTYTKALATDKISQRKTVNEEGFRIKSKRSGLPEGLKTTFGIICAVLLHLGFILFGGLIFLSHKKDHGTLQQVELLSEQEIEEEKLKEETKPEELEAETEEVPDATEMIKNIEMPAVMDAPELEAVSLSAIEAALSGQGGGSGDFASVMDFSSGGRIGGTGKGGALDESLEKAFSLAEIDQKPRAIFQAAPVYPSGMRNVEGVVTVLFIVDAKGRVSNPRAEKSSHPSFENPAIDAVKQWKFEPAVKGGERVPCKMRVPIRFKPS